MSAFSGSLDTSDQMAVLCILSHGSLGYVYGSDGNQVAITTLTGYLDDNNCAQMCGKPKFIVIQACQGG